MSSHVNAHATSTPVGDIAEYNALRRVFGDHLDSIAVSATKASTGHLLGGAGAIEAIFTVMALHERTAPPTINLTEQDPEIPLDVVTSPRALGDGDLVAISNSFGFGGHNAVVAFRTRLIRRGAHAPSPTHAKTPVALRRRGLRIAPGVSIVHRRDQVDQLTRHATAAVRDLQPTWCSQTTGAKSLGVAERLELVVPRLAERQAQLAVELARRRARDLHRVAHPILGDDHVAGGVGLGVEDAELGRVHPARAVGAGTRVLAHLESQVLPAAQRRREARAAAGLALPVELGAQRAAKHRLLGPVEVHRSAEGAAGRPFDMRADRTRCRVHEQHSSRGAQRPACSAPPSPSPFAEVRLPLRPRNERMRLFGWRRHAVTAIMPRIRAH